MDQTPMSNGGSADDQWRSVGSRRHARGQREIYSVSQRCPALHSDAFGIHDDRGKGDSNIKIL